jgi:transposase
MRHNFTFTEDQLRALRHERFHHPHPRVQQKMEVVWLKAQGVSQVEIARLTGLGRRTVVRYLHDFAEGGLEALRHVTVRPPRGELHEHRGELEDYFLGNPPQSVAQAQQEIKRLTGVERGLTQVRQFLKKLSGCAGGK